MVARVLIVDDSVVYRSGIRKALSGISSIEIVKAVSNGQLALDVLRQQKDNIDLITLDLEMPVMDGIQAIQEIRKFNKEIKIIVFSAISEKGATKTIEALRLGADDFVTKVDNSNSGSSEDGVDLIRQELLPRIEALLTKRSDAQVPRDVKIEKKEEVLAETIFNTEMPKLANIDLIFIGSSTGGPDALTRIFKKINKEVNIPILLVQHMPPVFTNRYAKALNEITTFEVLEIKGGEELLPGKAYLAPGDFHMRLVKKEGKYFLKLDQGEKDCFVRPSVNVTLNSIAENFNGRVLGIILTGMGEDGKKGMLELNKCDLVPCVQDKETSVVWGMPGAVANSGIQPHVLSLDNLAVLLNRV